MNKKCTLITFASWEERFISGTDRLIRKNKENNILFTDVIVLYSMEYSEVTHDNRLQIREVFGDNNIKPDFLKISFSDPASSWLELRDKIDKLSVNNNPAIVDISTMPRYYIFSIFNLLDNYGFITKSVYNSPGDYPPILCADPLKPCLIYKMSGEFNISSSTILITTIGFNPERISIMINYFEPALTFIGVQKGTQFENEVRTIKAYADNFDSRDNIKKFDIDVYNDEDRGYTKIRELVREHSSENIIMGCFGPKLSTVSMFKVFKNDNPRIGFCYVPMDYYDPDYSYGLGKYYENDI